MITRGDFDQMVAALGAVAVDDILWAEALSLPDSAEFFASETIFVICNSGMKNTVARGIYERVMESLRSGHSAKLAFRHEGKTSAIDMVWNERARLFAEFRKATDQLAFLAALPWIGNITKYHLAKNFGMDVAKPDVHLQRLANIHGSTPQELCEAVARETGYRVATVDTIIWRACANGVINSHTGEFVLPRESDRPDATSLF